MERKQIQEQRMKSYFIEATKELIKGEGLASVNVRSVAERAGYSYATLYNYFKDLNELIFECVKEFQAECESAIKTKVKKNKEGKERLKASIKSYVQFFIEYPGIFELFFLERMRTIGNRQATSELIYTFLDRVCEPHWAYCVEQNLYDREAVERKTRQLRFAIMGLLLFYQNRFQPEDYREFIALLTTQIDDIVE